MKRADSPELRTREAAYTKRWKAENPTAHAAQQARKHVREKDEQNAYVAQWKKDNKIEYNAYLASVKKRVKQATPTWCDLKEVRAFHEARPEGHEIDHIFPINGEHVSGLNVIWNMQYLTCADNGKKNNKFDFTYENEGWKNK